MKLLLIPTLLMSFLMGSFASAETDAKDSFGSNVRTAENGSYRWTAELSLIGGAFRNCGDPPFSKYKVEINGDVLTGVPVNGQSQFVRNVVLNISTLKPDGSGRVTVKAKHNNTVWHFDFDPGNGPRKFRVRQDGSECHYLWTPL